jgi:hypothetical protein
MKVFLSWSGDLSRNVASVLHEWLPNVIQEVDPWMSTEDIHKGSRWVLELNRELESQSVGIICLTRENTQSSWLNFEAGALAKAFDSARVCPLLVDMKTSEFTGPLAHFQATHLEDKGDVLRLVQTVNRQCSRQLGEKVLHGSFEKSWLSLLDAVTGCIEASRGKPAVKPRSPEDILEELLALARGTLREVQIQRMERLGVLSRTQSERPRATALRRTRMGMGPGKTMIIPAEVADEFRAFMAQQEWQRAVEDERVARSDPEPPNPAEDSSSEARE